MKVLERFERQFSLINALVSELESESSYRGVERLVQLIIQALLDLGLMVISVFGGRRPDRCSEIGEILQKLKVIDRDDARLLLGMAGLRNILIHAYAEVDRDKVSGFTDRLKVDALRVVENVERFIKSHPVDPPIASEDFMTVVERLSKVLRGRVRAAFLFGGKVKGYRLKGDYDLAVLMPKNYSLLDLGLIQVDAAKALGVDESLVDIVCLNEVSPMLVVEALEGIPILVEDQAEILELKLRTLTELIDLNESWKHTSYESGSVSKAQG